MPTLQNPKWELACQTMASGGISQAEAYLAVSTTKKKDKVTAQKFFSRPEIAARVHEIIAERHQMERQIAQRAAAEAEVDRAFVMRGLRNTALLAQRGHPMYDREGKRMRDADGNLRYGKPDLMSANRAYELMGREIGMFITRHEVGNPGDFARLTEDELNGQISETLQMFGVPEKLVKKLIADMDGTYREEEA